MINSVGIIILHWQNQTRTKRLLEKVLCWSELNIQIYLVQNETDKDLFVEFQHPRLTKITSHENLGFSGGVNLGLHKSTSDHKYSFLLNPDAIIEEQELKKLIIGADKLSDLFSIGPVIHESNQGNTKKYYGGKNISIYSNTRITADEIVVDSISEGYIEVFYNIGAAMLIDNNALKEIGFLDTDYFFSGEIPDICQRARDKNYKCYTQLNANAKHHTEDDGLRSSLYRYYSLRNRFLFIKKHKQYKGSLSKWRNTLLKDLMHSIIQLNFNAIRTIVLCATDSIFGNYGNRNHMFKNQISANRTNTSQ